MKPKTCSLMILGLCVAMLASAGAHAQSLGLASARPAPLYPYELQPGQSYAVEVAPGTYVIRRPYPYVGGPHRAHAAHSPRNDPALIDELRKRSAKSKIKREVINTTKVVRDRPVVIEHRHVVEDPPRVIERRHYVEDAPAPQAKQASIEADRSLAAGSAKHGSAAGEKRVIHAEAEVTILGPDRMSIRLFRKGGAGASASADVN